MREAITRWLFRESDQEGFDCSGQLAVRSLRADLQKVIQPVVLIGGPFKKVAPCIASMYWHFLANQK